MTHVHSTATRPGTAAGGDPSRAPVSTRVVVDASGGDGPAAGALSDALTALGLAPEAPDTEAPDSEAPDFEAPDTGRVDSGDPAPAAYCALLLGEEAYGAERSAGLDRARVRAAALAMAAAGRGRLVLVTDATGEPHSGTDPDRYARLAADRAWWQHLVTEVAGSGVTGNTVVTGYSPGLGHRLSAESEAGLLRYLVQQPAHHGRGCGGHRRLPGLRGVFVPGRRDPAGRRWRGPRPDPVLPMRPACDGPRAAPRCSA